MNKYQETLNGMDGIKMLIKVVLVECEFIKDLYNEELDRLRELVDKATPYKPKGKFYTMKECKCKNTVYRHHKYCHECGQALYWSEDE